VICYWIVSSRSLLDYQRNTEAAIFHGCFATSISWTTHPTSNLPHRRIFSKTQRIMPESFSHHAIQETPYKDFEPIEKLDAFIMFAMSRVGIHPNPMGPPDLFCSFGFCTYRDEYEKRKLGGVYNQLLAGNKQRVDNNKSLGISTSQMTNIPTADFEEFWTASRDGKLPELMAKYELEQQLQACKFATEFLALPLAAPHPKVWRLCHYLAFAPTNPTVPKEAEAGARHFVFTSSPTARTKIELRRVYTALLAKTSPLEIEAARDEGRLLAPAQGTLSDIDAGVIHTLKKLK
jgi:hypothetical protein